MVTVEVGQENDIDRARFDPQSVQVGKERRPGVEEDVAVDDYPGVVALARESRPRTKEGKPQAMVTALLRYTSWIALSSAIPSFIGR